MAWAIENNDNIKGMIFDMDGTLIDSMEGCIKIASDVLKSFGISDFSLTEAADGMSMEDILCALASKNSLSASIDEVEKSMEAELIKAYQTDFPLKAGAAEYLRYLHENKFKTAIATANYKSIAKAAAKRLGIDDFIDFYVEIGDVKAGKDKPDIYIYAAGLMKVLPFECCVCEDILTGIRSANSGGFKTLAIFDKSNEKHTGELKAEADYYIKDWRELPY